MRHVATSPATDRTKPPSPWSEGSALRPPGYGALPRGSWRDRRSETDRAPTPGGRGHDPRTRRSCLIPDTPDHAGRVMASGSVSIRSVVSPADVTSTIAAQIARPYSNEKAGL